jgi:hypothetical protein
MEYSPFTLINICPAVVFLGERYLTLKQEKNPKIFGFPLDYM